jgi:hypothetical protein
MCVFLHSSISIREPNGKTSVYPKVTSSLVWQAALSFLYDHHPSGCYYKHVNVLLVAFAFSCGASRSTTVWFISGVGVSISKVFHPLPDTAGYKACLSIHTTKSFVGCLQLIRSHSQGIQSLHIGEMTSH